MAASCTAHAGRVETCALEEYPCSGIGHTGIKATENTGHSLGLGGIAYHQVGGIKSALYAVEGCKLTALLGTTNYDAVTGQRSASKAWRG